MPVSKTYLDPTQESGRDFYLNDMSGPIVMLNLLRFREVADYSASPELAPAEPISGAKAYEHYMKHTQPFLQASGGEVLFMGKGGSFLIGPTDEKWDAVMLVKQQSKDSFMAFAQNEGYLKGIGHRTAALADSRLLPIQEGKMW
ncbi:DUF1330 domain-containing protein [Neolewinella persica]|uniref:DUF1330 domain-containing protein n=1 Tax=Neolewinella persica TaxID=70998 RepID=UPI000372D233|nr:DUF1330 domain-containing protein [Neolewinella persica]